jgi:L-ascorbate metabolism protein UlaG (beta-lactamase superfamily)
MKSKLWPGLFLILFFLISCSAANSTEPVFAVATVEITYLANEGFLIESSGKRVLVDALFRDGIKPYLTVPADLRDKLEKAQKPFDSIDLILASHFHADHYDGRAVAEHLTNNPNALFVSTNQSIEKMKTEYANFASLQDRARGIYPKEGERVTLTHRGINLQVLNVHHGRNRPIENLGLIWEIGGKKFLHIGDSMANAADFKSYEVLKDKIDFAFLPYWYFMDEDYKKAVREFIKPRFIVLMHIPDSSTNDEFINKVGGWQKWFAQVKSEFPNAIIFDRQMEKKSFD